MMLGLTLGLVRPVVIIGGAAVLLTLNAREFHAKRRALEAEFPAGVGDGAVLALSRRQAFLAQNIEQLLHMIHTMLAAILVSLLWR